MTGMLAVFTDRCGQDHCQLHERSGVVVEVTRRAGDRGFLIELADGTSSFALAEELSSIVVVA